MNWTVLVAFCIIDDLLKALGPKDDPQSKTPASVVLTLWVLAALFFSGQHKHALAYCKEHARFSFIPSRSRFCRRLHSLSHGIPHLLPLGQSLWQHLSFAPRCRLAPGLTYRGYIPSKRVYFHGLKLHLRCTDQQFITEVLCTPGSVADVQGRYLMPLNRSEGSERYVDRGYTDYLAEDELQTGEGIRLRAVRNMHALAYGEKIAFPRKITYLRPGPVKGSGDGMKNRPRRKSRNVVVARTRATGACSRVV